jgi:hypothetical protein
MSNKPSQPGEKSGLTKIEAEDLLDQLEAVGYDVCQLSFDDRQGFRVQPDAASEQADDKLIAN